MYKFEGLHFTLKCVPNVLVLNIALLVIIGH